MSHDRPAGTDVESAAVPADDGADERRAHVTSGDRLARVGMVGGTGVLILSGGVAGVGGLLARVTLPPAASIVLFSLVALVAVAGMAIAARITAGSRPAPREVRPADGTRTHPAPAPLPAPQPAAPPTPLDRFQVETRNGRRLVAAASVEWFEAQGNYARLHVGDESFVHRMPLSELEQVLTPRRFLRVHRSTIVNLDAIRRVEPLPSGDAELWLASGARVRLSRRYAKTFHERTGRAR